VDFFCPGLAEDLGGSFDGGAGCEDVVDKEKAGGFGRSAQPEGLFSEGQAFFAGFSELPGWKERPGEAGLERDLERAGGMASEVGRHVGCTQKAAESRGGDWDQEADPEFGEKLP